MGKYAYETVLPLYSLKYSNRFISYTLLFVVLSFLFALYLQMDWVIVPIGQYTHQERGLNKTIVMRPSNVEVNIRL